MGFEIRTGTRAYKRYVCGYSIQEGNDNFVTLDTLRVHLLQLMFIPQGKLIGTKTTGLETVPYHVILQA